MKNLKVITSDVVPQGSIVMLSYLVDTHKVSGVMVDEHGNIKADTWYEKVVVRVPHPTYFHVTPPGIWRAVKRGNGWSYERVEEDEAVERADYTITTHQQGETIRVEAHHPASGAMGWCQRFKTHYQNRERALEILRAAVGNTDLTLVDDEGVVYGGG